jgi:hypothetical protein
MGEILSFGSIGFCLEPNLEEFLNLLLAELPNDDIFAP